MKLTTWMNKKIIIISLISQVVCPCPRDVPRGNHCSISLKNLKGLSHEMEMCFVGMDKKNFLRRGASDSCSLFVYFKCEVLQKYGKVVATWHVNGAIILKMFHRLLPTV
jgi:hypothetical protein